MRAVGASLGPDGRTILYARGPRDVAEAATGFAIAREMPMADGPRGTAPRLLKEALFAVDRDFGDGTARLALIAGECFSAGWRESLSGNAVQPLCDMMGHLSEEVAAWLPELRDKDTDMMRVARSCGLTEALAENLAGLVSELGSDAGIDLKENDRPGIEVTRANGFVLDAAPAGNPALSTLSSPSILVADEMIHDFGSLARVLEGFANKRKPLVIVARGITGPALATLKQNQDADIVTVAALQPSEAGQQAADSLEDLASASGATLIAERFGLKLEALRPPMLGQAAEFRFAAGRATFISPKGDPETVALRRRMLAVAAEKARYLSYDREVLERRRARLAGQWCELRIAGENSRATAAMIAGAKAALRSMQSSLRHGSVSGGGAVFADLALRLRDREGAEVERAAARAIAHALLAIPRHMALNSNSPDPSTSLRPEVVQDPVFLTKMVINQGVALAAMLLRTGAVITR
jgi:chaperonin GroEL (HSP60 family)